VVVSRFCVPVPQPTPHPQQAHISIKPNDVAHAIRTTYTPRKRCREHDGLLAWTNVIDNLGDLRLEPHVEHAICLIQNQERGAAQVGDTTAIGGQDVDHSAGSTNHNLGATLEIADLMRNTRATVHTNTLQFNNTQASLSK
jgi:hypothetical protein